MRHQLLIGGVGLVLVVGQVVLAADEAHPLVWEPAVRSVAVFKNGIGFFIRDGEVQLRDGWCVARAVPPALLGTLAVYAEDERAHVDILGAGQGELVDFDGVDGPADIAGRLAWLQSYIGLRLNLTFRPAEGADREAHGKLKQVEGEYAILENDGQLNAVLIGQIRRAQILDYALRIHVADAPVDKPVRLGMAYLRKGITWIPEYALRIIDEETAELTLRGTLVNEVEDLINTDVHFVVGVPHFAYADYLTPLAVGQMIRTAAAAVPEQFLSQIAGNAIMNRAALATDSRAGTELILQPAPAGGNPEAVDGMLRSLPQMDGAGASDYTVYTRAGLTLRCGEKAVVTIFQKRIRYGHTYRWESPGELRHFLVLHNDTDTAWTTGPVVAVSAARPLCQDRILYTPRGGRHHLPVTTAINIATNAEETEVERKLKAHEPTLHYWVDQVSLRGRLVVENYEDRKVELTIRRLVPGRLTAASDNGRISNDSEQLKLEERRGWVEWVLYLAPRERRELTYDYERYVPSR